MMHDRVRSAASQDDEGVSPVIAVILMVAITVVLAATVYVWVSGFASQDSGPEQASATARGFSTASNGTVNWIRVTLTDADNAPYSEDQVAYTVLDPNGNSYNEDASTDTNDRLCTNAKDGDDDGICDSDFHSSSSTNEWDAGQTLYVPCQMDGDHSITISVKGTTILDSTVNCEMRAGA